MSEPVPDPRDESGLPCPTCGHDAADMKRRLDDLVIAARNHWGVGSEPHNLIRDVSDAILRYRPAKALPTPNEEVE